MLINLVSVFAIFLAVSQTPVMQNLVGPHSSQILAVLALYAPVSVLLSFSQGLLKWTFQRTQYICLALGVPATSLVIIVSLAKLGDFGPLTALRALTAVSALFACVGLFLVPANGLSSPAVRTS